MVPMEQANHYRSKQKYTTYSSQVTNIICHYTQPTLEKGLVYMNQGYKCRHLVTLTSRAGTGMASPQVWDQMSLLSFHIGYFEFLTYYRSIGSPKNASEIHNAHKYVIYPTSSLHPRQYPRFNGDIHQEYYWYFPCFVILIRAYKRTYAVLVGPIR